MPFSLNIKSYNGTWAFKVPVKVDKTLSKKIEFKNTTGEGITLDSVVITPFETITTVNFGNIATINKQGLDMYEVKLYDENNKEISFTNNKSDSSKIINLNDTEYEKFEQRIIDIDEVIKLN